MDDSMGEKKVAVLVTKKAVKLVDNSEKLKAEKKVERMDAWRDKW